MKQLKLYLDGKRQPQRFEKYAKEKFQKLKPQEVKENMLNDGVLSNAVFIKRASCVLYDFLFFARAQIISSRARNIFARAGKMIFNSIICDFKRIEKTLKLQKEKTREELRQLIQEDS